MPTPRQPKKFSEYTPITVTDGEEIIPILKNGANKTVRIKNLSIPLVSPNGVKWILGITNQGRLIPIPDGESIAPGGNVYLSTYAATY